MLEGPNKLGIGKFSQMRLLITGKDTELTEDSSITVGISSPKTSFSLPLSPVPPSVPPPFLPTVAEARHQPDTLVNTYAISFSLQNSSPYLFPSPFYKCGNWFRMMTGHIQHYTASEWKILIMCFFSPPKQKTELGARGPREDYGNIQSTEGMPYSRTQDMLLSNTRSYYAGQWKAIRLPQIWDKGDAQEMSSFPSVSLQRPGPTLTLSLSWMTFPAHYMCTCVPIL